jgi:hypothetical protein
MQYKHVLFEMSPQSESNQRPTDYKSVALPAELWRLTLMRLSVLKRCKGMFYFEICKHPLQLFLIDKLNVLTLRDKKLSPESF